jgi:hypothetical protein
MRLVVILWRLLPLALAFWRDHRRWLFFGAPARPPITSVERVASSRVSPTSARRS